MSGYEQLSIDRSKPGRWTVTFSNPPINILGPVGIRELRDLVVEAEADTSVRVVVFRSGNPDFFIAHFETPDIGANSGPSGAEVSKLWIEFVLRLSSAPFVSMAEISRSNAGGR